jgi:hypothetical protein
MEWVDGESLKEYIVSRRRMGVRQSIAASVQLLDGLSAIHDAGIIHRDIKPQNIMVGDDGVIKLTDFGIARLVSEVNAQSDGMTAGSAAYMAPEQAQGLPLNPTADIYASGVILFEMLTGRLPFNDIDPQTVMKKHISEPPPNPRKINPSIPVDVEAIVLKALSKDPADRYQTAQEMRNELIAAYRALSSPAPAGLEDASAPPTPWARFALFAASIAVAMIVLAGATTLAVRDSGAVSSTPEPPSSNVLSSAEPTAAPETDVESQGEPSWVATTRQANEERTRPDRDEDVIQGEIPTSSNGQEETAEQVNRPAPTLDPDEIRAREEPVAAVPVAPAVQAPVQSPAPAPTEVPEEADDASGEDDDETSGNDDGSDMSEEQPGNEPADPGDQQETGQGDQTGANAGDGGSDQTADDEQPASNQQSPDVDDGVDEDSPTSNQDAARDPETDDSDASNQEHASGDDNDFEDVDEEEAEFTVARSGETASPS